MNDWEAAWEVVCILNDTFHWKMADWEKAESAFYLLDLIDPSWYVKDMRASGREDLVEWLQERRNRNDY